MSYQLVCDNCGFSHKLQDSESMKYGTLPTNWERIFQSTPASHLCPECVIAKDQAKWDMQGKIRKAEEAALEARRVKA